MRLYRMLKKGALAWSIGFSITRSTPPRRDSPGVLEEVGELYELSIVPVAANPRTSTLSLKGEEPEVPSHAAVERRLIEEGIIARIADDDLVEREHDALESVLWTRRNGQQHAEAKAARTAAKASPRAVTIATFPTD